MHSFTNVFFTCRWFHGRAKEIVHAFQTFLSRAPFLPCDRPLYENSPPFPSDLLRQRMNYFPWIFRNYQKISFEVSIVGEARRWFAFAYRENGTLQKLSATRSRFNRLIFLSSCNKKFSTFLYVTKQKKKEGKKNRRNKRGREEDNRYERWENRKSRKKLQFNPKKFRHGSKLPFEINNTKKKKLNWDLAKNFFWIW